MRKTLAFLVNISLGVASAIWLIPASVHIVNWQSSGPVRVALLQPLSKLWWLVGSSLLVTGAVAALAFARDRAAVAKLAHALAPLTALWLWLPPYAPWLPDRAPLLLVLAGPLRWFIGALAIAGTVWRLASRAGWRGKTPGLPGRRLVFAFSLAVYLGLGLRSAITVGPGGDEPHYLVIAHSLLVDHDLKIENNHAQRDYRDFFAGELHPDYLRRGRDGQIYSIHAPGLPALLLPAYAVAGYHGAVACIAFLAALAALAVFDLAEAVAGRVPALITWAAVCMTVPFVPHGWLIYPEVPAALLVAWALLWTWKPLSASSAIWLMRGIALGVLPWLHTKFVVLLVMLTAFLLLRLWPRVKSMALLLMPIGVSMILWLLSFYWMYGVFDPEAPYGSYTQNFMRAANIPRGLLGLLFDQKFGLLAYAPVYLLVAAGCWRMLRRRDLQVFAIGLSVVSAVFVLNTTRVYMWWGGASAPARFLVPVLPLVAPMIAVACDELRGLAGRATLGALLSISLLIAAAGIGFPEMRLLFSAPHGNSRLAEAVQAGAPLSALLPTFTDENWRAPLRMLVPWLAAGVVGLTTVTWLASRWKTRPSSFSAATLGFAAFALSSSILAGSPTTGARFATVTRGRLELMNAYDSPRLRGFDYSRTAKLDERQLMELATVLVRAEDVDASDPRRLAGPFALPAGRYQLRIWFERARRIDGDAIVSVGSPDLPLTRVDGPLSNPLEMPFELPADATIWVGLTDRDAAMSVRRIDLVPVQIVARSQRPAIDVRAVEPIPGWRGGFIVYADNTYAEGGVYWTRGTRSGHVWVVPSNASTILLTLHVGPTEGKVRVNAAGHDLSLDMSRDETRQIAVPVPPATSLVPIVVTAAGMFRPADIDRGSSDLRWLGCQVRIELK